MQDEERKRLRKKYPSRVPGHDRKCTCADCWRAWLKWFCKVYPAAVGQSPRGVQDADEVPF